MIYQCPPLTPMMQAIVTTESHHNPLVIGLNHGYKLALQPKNLLQAQHWVNYLEANRYNFDVGLAQVNISNIHHYGYKAIDALNPCLNLQLGQKIFLDNYKQALSIWHQPQEALRKAISAYNSGNYYTGFYNGYVAKVYANLKDNNQYKTSLALNYATDDVPPIMVVKDTPPDARHNNNEMLPTDYHNNAAFINHKFPPDRNLSVPNKAKTVLFSQAIPSPVVGLTNDVLKESITRVN